MKKILFGFLIILAACNNKTNEQKQVNLENNLDKYLGTYECIAPDTPDETNYIVISKTDNKYSGIYYATSDEFDENREGYAPGFFVTNMNNLEFTGDSIKFSIKVEPTEIVSKPVNLKIKSVDEALKSGYKVWENTGIPTFPKDYVGIFKNPTTIFFKGSQEIFDKTFKKKQ